MTKTNDFERVPFLALGRSLEAVRAFLEARAATQEDARRLVRAAFGLDEDREVSLVSQGFHYVGFAPKGWEAEHGDRYAHSAKVASGRTDAGARYLIPYARTKTGRTLGKALAAIRRPSGWSFTESLGLKALLLPATGRVTTASFERIGELYVIHVPHNPDAVCEDSHTPVPEVQVPPDAARLKLSEYHRMREEAEQHEATRP